VFPTVTYPTHTSLITGVPPALHGIVTNKQPDPLGRNKDGWRWYAEDIAVPTLWHAVEAQHRRAALVSWPVTVGADATFVVPEYWRAGTADDQKLLRSLSTRGLLDRVAREEPALWRWLTPPSVEDAAQFAIARYLIAHEQPELVLVHAWQLDDAQHAHGPDSAAARHAIEHADRLLGTLLETIERSPDAARTILAVVSDHGFAPQHREVRPYVHFAEHGLIAREATPPAVAIAADGAAAFVYVRDPAARLRIEQAIATVPGVARVMARAELAALGADPEADYALVAAAGHGFSDARVSPVVVETPGRGTHGWPPEDPAMAASFLAVGPGIVPRDLGQLRMVDVAPTLARWLDVELPSAVGTAVGLR
jgi:predicted AlkP superfamily pyrophosphatase or phosphodiesterase